jgi:uncharacterized secreted protein with C-terminal beta-propeller domain
MRSDRQLVAVVLAAAIVGSAVGAGAMALAPGGNGPSGPAVQPSAEPSVPTNASDDPGIERFDSKADFQRYARQTAGSATYVMRGASGGAEVAVDTPTAQPSVETDAASRAYGAGDGGATGEPSRYSGTNVQERGIREPDVLKSDGETIYFSNRQARVYYGGRAPAGRTHVVDASAPANPELIGNVSDSGRMFLAGDTLVVVGNDAVSGYDVSDPANPTGVWEHSLDGRVAAARMLDGEMYLVVQQGVTPSSPCPIEPIGDGPTVRCTDVYHPVGDASAEVTYTTVRMNPDSGTVEDSVSVVGSRQHSATYVSEDAVYLTYTRDASYLDVMTTFLLEEKRSLLGTATAERLETVRELNISERARQVELRVTLQRWMESFDEGERQSIQEELQADFETYVENNKRDLSTTGIVEVSIDGDLSIEASGEVPGHPLNQFSMDEADGDLRIATTVSGPRGESENDLYTLDSDLDRQGSVQGMAPGQRIYSVRYVGDTAYVVTFRQIDPFHVIDLSDPANPEELGQVKLPGFSRYLHPMGNDTVLGIGQEDGRVKATLFDVSTPSEPKVKDSKIVDDSWSAISESHHAFLLDRKHGVFFLPGSRGGYVFGYEDGLTIEHRVDTQGAASRAMYIDDYMYVFAQGGVTVVDETDWSRADRIDFPEYREPEPEPQPEPRPPRIDVEAEYDDGTLGVTHRAGRDVEGENLAFQCDGTAVEIEDGTYEPGDVILETTECSPGEDARLVWQNDEGDTVRVVADFRVPDED